MTQPNTYPIEARVYMPVALCHVPSVFHISSALPRLSSRHTPHCANAGNRSAAILWTASLSNAFTPGHPHLHIHISNCPQSSVQLPRRIMVIRFPPTCPRKHATALSTSASAGRSPTAKTWHAGRTLLANTSHGTIGGGPSTGHGLSNTNTAPSTPLGAPEGLRRPPTPIAPLMAISPAHCTAALTTSKASGEPFSDRLTNIVLNQKTLFESPSSFHTPTRPDH